ncbi:MAG TPA: VCBS repeat-containing protein, partial [Polyangia bacterium]
RGGASGASGRGGAGGTGGGGRGGASGGGGSGANTVTFVTRTLSTANTAEGADVGDINGDGILDLVAGPTWYAGPDFALGGTVMPNPPAFPMDQYSTFFLTFVDDVNGDGRPDVIAIGDAGGGNGTGNPNAFWYANPGAGNFSQAWTKTAIFNGLVANESPAFLDLVGDGKRELVFMTSMQLGYARPGATAAAPWTFTAVSGTTSFGTPYVHGLGVGDVDGDGMPDIVERSGWWRQVAGATWERHAFDFWTGSTSGRASNWGGSEMYVYDVDGDGDADVVSVLAAHQYGLAWFEQQGTGASSTFVAHQILSTAQSSSNLSQMHAMALADVNGDGLLDIVTGKRYYAHPSTNPDPGTTDPALTVWFELQRGAGGATFVEHVVHMASGVGCNFIARDVTGDGKVDIFTTNKHGTFLHVQQ